MTLRVRLALALSLLTAIAVTAMALVGVPGHGDSALPGDRPVTEQLGSTRFADPTAVRRPGLRPAPGERSRRRQRRTGRRSSWHRGPVPRRLTGPGMPRRPRSPCRSTRTTCGSPAAGRASSIRTAADDRILTVAVRGGGAIQLSRELDEVRHVLANLRVRFAVIGASITMLAALVGWWIALSGHTARDPPDRRDRGDRRERPPRRRRAHGRVRRDRPPRAQLRDDARRPASVTGAAAAARRRTPATSCARPLTSLRTNVERAPPPPRPRPRDPGPRARRHRRRAAGADRPHQRAGRARHRGRRRRADPGGRRRRRWPAAPPRRTRAAAPAHGRWSTPSPGRERSAAGSCCGRSTTCSTTPPSSIRRRRRSRSIVRPGTITVRDHGAGVAPTDQPRVFDRFYRAPSARARAGIGTGLGDRPRRRPPARRHHQRQPTTRTAGRSSRSRCRRRTQVSPARPPHRRSRRPMGRRRCLTRRLPEPDRSLTRRPKHSLLWHPDRRPEPSRPPTTEMPAASDSAGSRAGSPPEASPGSASSRWSRRRPLLRRRCQRRRPW